MTTYRTILLCCAFVAYWNAPQAQQPSSQQFEVASVKENLAQTADSTMNHGLADRFTATNVPLVFLILDAYTINAHQLIGAPDWASDKSYDIVGTFPTGDRPRIHEMHLMEQHLLEERFGLRLHADQREVPAYDLVLAKNDGRLGPQIHASTMDCAVWTANGRPKASAASKSPVSPTGERPTCSLVTTRTWLSGGAIGIKSLASSLEAMLDRPVVDKTGLAGVYDIDLRWIRTDLHAGDASANADADAPSLFTAVEEQLGLKLVPHKEMLDVLVVDHVQAPTAN